MSTSRAGRKTRPLYTSITGTQPSRSSTGVAGSDDVDPLLSTASSTSGADTPSPVDSEGRIYVQISPLYDQFVGGYPTPGTKIGKYSRSRVMSEFWPNWKSLPLEERENAWEEFKGKFTWRGDIEEETARYVFKKQAQKLFRDHIGNTKKQYYIKRLEAKLQPLTPPWMTEEVFLRFCEHWASDGAIAITEHAKANREGSSGSATSHTMGTIGVGEHHYCMERDHGPDVSFFGCFR